MLFAATSVTVRNLTLSPVIWPSTRENSGWSSKLYTFKERLEEFPLTVRVSIIKRDFDLLLTADMIRVLFRGKWKPLKTWLLEWVQEDNRFPFTSIHNRPNYVQQTWWCKNGKVFRLMDLPQEIRFIILKHALGGFIHPAVIYNHSSSEYRRLDPRIHVSLRKEYRQASPYGRYQDLSERQVDLHSLYRVPRAQTRLPFS